MGGWFEIGDRHAAEYTARLGKGQPADPSQSRRIASRASGGGATFVAAACTAALRTGRAPRISYETVPAVRRQAHRARHTAREQCCWHEQPVVAPVVGPASSERRRSPQRWRCACGAPRERRDCSAHHGGVSHSSCEHPCCPRGRPEPCARDGASDACAPRRLDGPDAISDAAPPPRPSAWHVSALEPSITSGTALFPHARNGARTARPWRRRRVVFSPHARNGARTARPWRRRRVVECARLGSALAVPICGRTLAVPICGRTLVRPIRLPVGLPRSLVLDDKALS